MNDLPPTVRQALQLLPGPAAIPIESDGDTAILVKAAASDVRSFHRPAVAVAYRYELGLYPAGAAIRLAFTIHDRPGQPYGGEAFLNPAAPGDRALLGHLARQSHLTFHFYDLDLRYHFSKLLRHRPMIQREVAQLTALALAHNATLSPGDLNFPQVTYQFQKDRPNL